jgi:hypothetical protein
MAYQSTKLLHMAMMTPLSSGKGRHHHLAIGLEQLGQPDE